MAQIGLKHLYIAKINHSLDSDEADPTYIASSGKKIGNIISADLTWNSGNVKLHGDNRLVLMDNGANGGNLKIETTYIPEDEIPVLMGYSEETNGSLYKVDEPTDTVGCGYITKEIDEYGTVTYWLNWFYKVQFSMNNQSFRTREDGTAYGVPTIEAEIFKCYNGFGYVEPYTSESTALTALQTQACYSPSGS